MLKKIFIDGEVPGVPVFQWALLLASAAVPFAWWLFPAYKNELWSVSWIAVVTLMCVRPLADIFPGILFFRTVLQLRKGLGILSASVVVTSLAFTLAAASAAKIASTYFSTKGWGLASRSAFARISEITGVLLLITSNSFSQKLLGANWKRLQRLSYAYFYSAGILLFYYGQTSVAYGMALVTALWIGAEIRKSLR